MKTIPNPQSSAASETVIGDAERWFARLRAHDTSDTERAQYDKWLAHNDEHRRAAQECQQVWQLADALADDPEILAYANETPLQPAAAPAVPVSAGRRRGWMRRIAVPVALAASLALAAILIRPDLVGIGPTRYVTKVGEQRRVVLADGSIMHLNTDTRVEVSYQEHERLVRIVAGEATFSVEHDTSRPFIVRAGHGFVRAVGTRFNVYNSRERVTVAVLEGAVVVGPDPCEPGAAGATTASPCRQLTSTATASTQELSQLPLVKAGQEVTYSTPQVVPSPVAASGEELHRVTAWQKGKLEFDAVPLASALTEINRYLKRKIVLADPQLSTVRVTGVFRVGDADSVIFALREMLGVSSQRYEDEIWLSAPARIGTDQAISL